MRSILVSSQLNVSHDSVSSSWLLALAALVALFSTWDDGATSLFVGAIVPLHVLAFEMIMRQMPSRCVAPVIALSRVTLLLPLFVAAAL